MNKNISFCCQLGRINSFVSLFCILCLTLFSSCFTYIDYKYEEQRDEYENYNNKFCENLVDLKFTCSSNYLKWKTSYLTFDIVIRPWPSGIKPYDRFSDYAHSKDVFLYSYTTHYKLKGTDSYNHIDSNNTRNMIDHYELKGTDSYKHVDSNNTGNMIDVDISKIISDSIKMKIQFNNLIKTFKVNKYVHFYFVNDKLIRIRVYYALKSIDGIDEEFLEYINHKYIYVEVEYNFPRNVMGIDKEVTCKYNTKFKRVIASKNTRSFLHLGH